MKEFLASVWLEDSQFVAQCLDLDVASQGGSEAEAVENLKEAVRLHFTHPLATLLPKVVVLEVDGL